MSLTCKWSGEERKACCFHSHAVVDVATKVKWDAATPLTLFLNFIFLKRCRHCQYGWNGAIDVKFHGRAESARHKFDGVQVKFFSHCSFMYMLLPA